MEIKEKEVGGVSKDEEKQRKTELLGIRLKNERMEEESYQMIKKLEEEERRELVGGAEKKIEDTRKEEETAKMEKGIGNPGNSTNGERSIWRWRISRIAAPDIIRNADKRR